MSIRTIPADEFKARCMALMDEVPARREAVVITKRGKPVAKLVPANRPAEKLVSRLAGKGTVTGDVVSPILDWGSRG